MGGPALLGSRQLTSRLLLVSFVGLTVGAGGAPGGSSGSSVTVMVTRDAALPRLRSTAFTLTV